MNPLTLPVGLAVRVLGDLTAIATAARAMVPAAEGMAKVDFEQVQDDLHVLARVAQDLPRVEGELTRRMDEAEDTLERAVAAAERLGDGLPTLERGADAAEKLVDGLDEVRQSRDALLEALKQADELIAASARAQKSLDRASENVEVALARAEPLQGLAERVGRLSERLPGGGAGAGRPPGGSGT